MSYTVPVKCAGHLQRFPISSSQNRQVLCRAYELQKRRVVERPDLELVTEESS